MQAGYTKKLRANCDKVVDLGNNAKIYVAYENIKI